jgi:phosphate transport system protein
MEKGDITQHTSSGFNAELAKLASLVKRMGTLVLEQITGAVEAVVAADLVVAEQVVTSDHRINALELRIDEECANIIARRQPAAADLRFILAMTKTTADLERMGDEAKRIAEMALRIADSTPVFRETAWLRRLGATVRSQVADTLQALDQLDVKLAAQVARGDLAVDREFDALVRAMVEHMGSNPPDVAPALHVMWAARSLERIGDRARNVCQYVVYIVRGKDLRHASLDDFDLEVAETS